MKIWTTCALAIVMLLPVLGNAQPPEGRRGEGRRAEGRDGDAGNRAERGRRGEGRGGEFGGPGRRGEGPPPHPVIEALDADGDGDLSADEIKNAAAALKELDQNGDGRLSREEMRPQRPGQGFGQRGPQGRGPRPEGGGPGRGPSADRIMQMDRNKDGKVSQDEMPEFFADRLLAADADGDKAITRAEAEKFVARIRERFGQGGGARGRRLGDSPEEAEGGARPRRPASE